MRYKIKLLLVVWLFSSCLQTNFINGVHTFTGPQSLPWKHNGCGSLFDCFALALPVVILFRNLLGQRNIGSTTPAQSTPTTPARTTPTTPARTTSTTPARTTPTTPARTTPTTPARTTSTTPARTTPTTPARTTPTTPAQTTTTHDPACQAKYSLYNESCGRLCYRYESSDCQVWSNARDACEEEGGALLEPSECSYEFFRKRALGNTGICQGDFWLGAQRPTNGAEFRTLSGDRIPDMANFWAPGQPNNQLGKQNCLEMGTSYDLKANDIECNFSNGYICQIKV